MLNDFISSGATFTRSFRDKWFVGVDGEGRQRPGRARCVQSFDFAINLFHCTSVSMLLVFISFCGCFSVLVYHDASLELFICMLSPCFGFIRLLSVDHECFFVCDCLLAIPCRCRHLTVADDCLEPTYSELFKLLIYLLVTPGICREILVYLKLTHLCMMF